MTSSFRLRSRLVLLAVVLFALLICGKLFLVQVVHSETYTETANRQYFTPAGNVFERGTIYFTERNGQLVSAATQTTGYKVALAPRKITDAALVYEKLSALTPIDREEFMAKAGKQDDPYEEVAYHLSKEKADSISALKLPGVSIFKEKWRFYPGENMAAHTLGLVAYKGDDLSGRYGLERQYDQVLKREDNNPYVNFFAEVFSNIGSSLSGEEREGNVV